MATRAFGLLVTRARANAAVNSGAANPGGPTGSLRGVGLDRCIHAPAAAALATATATIKTIQRQALPPYALHGATVADFAPDAERTCQVLAPGHERAPQPRRRRYPARRRRWAQRLPGRDPGGLPGRHGPDLYRSPVASQPGLRLLQGSEARRGRPEGHLPGARRRGRPGPARRLRGRALGPPLPRHRPELPTGLERGRAV